MANKFILSAKESASFDRSGKEIRSIQKLLESYSQNNLPKDFLLPRELITEIANFIERNLIISKKELQGKDTLKACCLRCCKAHALSFAKKCNVSEEGIKYLESLFKVETGHNGFYLDGNTLKRCDY